jgi:hypothetical protein
MREIREMGKWGDREIRRWGDREMGKFSNFLDFLDFLISCFLLSLLIVNC